MRISSQQFRFILHRIGERIELEKDRLSDLDRIIGDGDHGISMAIGWKAIRARLDQLQQTSDIGEILTEVSSAFLNSVGASVGPLYGMGFLRGSAAAAGKTELTEPEIVQFWCAFVQGIQKIGKAEVGDKTMMDTWLPIAEVLERSTASGEALLSALTKAVEAGRRGMEATEDMVSQKGRSGRLGERSKGSIDPGAASAQLIFATFVEVCEDLQRSVKG